MLILFCGFCMFWVWGCVRGVGVLWIWRFWVCDGVVVMRFVGGFLGVCVFGFVLFSLLLWMGGFCGMGGVGWVCFGVVLGVVWIFVSYLGCCRFCGCFRFGFFDF